MPAEIWSYDIIREAGEVVLRINLDKYPYTPSLEDDPVCMSKTIDILLHVGEVTRIVYYQKRDYEYDYSQVQFLLEIARLYSRLSRQREIIGYSAMGTAPEGCTRCYNKRYAFIQNTILKLLKSDPVGSYVEIRRELRNEKIRIDKIIDKRCLPCIQQYSSVLQYLTVELGKTALVKIAEPYLAGYKTGDRTIYKRIFRPLIKPDFMFTRLMADYPIGADEIDTYRVGDTEVSIYSMPNTIQNLYHIMPPEFKLNEDKYEILDTARKVMAEHKPKKAEFVDPERMRQVFYNVGHDLIEELAASRNIKLRGKEIDVLTKILVRYTVGFGLIEVLLADEKVQDLTINSPMGNTPIFIVHAEHADCKTNIMPVRAEAESWSAKLRMISGRPLDEANPVLDTELSLPGARTRVCAITAPLNPTGLAYAFRRHRDQPWTLPLFVANGMINPLSAGMLSFLIDGTRTMLVAGTRSAGKTSLLAALMVEIMRKYRMITIEDTLELPTKALVDMGYNVQSMKVRSALARGGTEVPAEEGIRTSLRMGDSALIIGEVRSKEALALYEAMRVGAMANTVAGTIHGESAYGVFDRVVNDLGVPRTSFKATDIVVVCNPIRSSDGLHRWRRVTQLTEVRKHWETDPSLEGGFVDLMKYDTKTDQLEASSDLINGDSDILKAIAGNVKEWAGNWDAVWDNITLRAKVKERLVNYAKKSNMMNLLEAPFVILSNDHFHRVSDSVREDVGFLDSKRIYFEWNEWLKRAIKKKKL